MLLNNISLSQRDIQFKIKLKLCRKIQENVSISSLGVFIVCMHARSSKLNAKLDICKRCNLISCMMHVMHAIDLHCSPTSIFLQK